MSTAVVPHESLSVEPNADWWETTHHELGHIYYFLGYSRPEVPLLLREGANRAFHEAVGELARLASMQTPTLQRLGLLRGGVGPDPTAVLKSLNGTEWRLDNLCGVAAVAKYNASLAFGVDGYIAGQGGVNRFGGRIKVAEKTFKVGPLSVTGMASEPAAMAQEAKYLKALQSATALVVEGDELRITCAGQEQPLVFSKINKP